MIPGDFPHSRYGHRTVGGDCNRCIDRSDCCHCCNHLGGQKNGPILVSTYIIMNKKLNNIFKVKVFFFNINS